MGERTNNVRQADGRNVQQAVNSPAGPNDCPARYCCHDWRSIKRFHPIPSHAGPVVVNNLQPVSQAQYTMNSHSRNLRTNQRRRWLAKAKHGRRHRSLRSGAAAVEFALVAPLLFMLTLGMMEVSRMVMVKQLLTNASREGARLAVLPGTTSAEVLELVSNELTAYSVNGVRVQVQPASLASAVAGTPVTVSLDVEAASVSWIPTPLFSFNQTLNASTTMRKESL